MKDRIRIVGRSKNRRIIIEGLEDGQFGILFKTMLSELPKDPETILPNVVVHKSKLRKTVLKLTETGLRQLHEGLSEMIKHLDS